MYKAERRDKSWFVFGESVFPVAQALTEVQARAVALLLNGMDSIAQPPSRTLLAEAQDLLDRMKNWSDKKRTEKPKDVGWGTKRSRDLVSR